MQEISGRLTRAILTVCLALQACANPPLLGATAVPDAPALNDRQLSNAAAGIPREGTEAREQAIGTAASGGPEGSHETEEKRRSRSVRDAQAPANNIALGAERLARLQRVDAYVIQANKLFGQAAKLRLEALEADRYRTARSLSEQQRQSGTTHDLLKESAAKQERAEQLKTEALNLRQQILEDLVNLSAHGQDVRAMAHLMNKHAALLALPNFGVQSTGALIVVPRLPQQQPANKLPMVDPSPSPPSARKSEPVVTPAASFVTESGKIDGLVQGSAGVSAPSNTTAGESFSVYLRVSPEKLAILLRGLQDDFPSNQTVQGKQGVKLTPRMTATVSGFGFEVSPKEGQVQAVSATEATTWPWQVKALESGVHTLTFTLAGTLTIEGKEVARNFYQYQQKVEVQVSPVGFAEKYWQWLVTTLAIPAIGAVWAVFRKPKDSSGKRLLSLADKLRERRRLETRA